MSDVRVVDTSTLIKLKTVVPVVDQWRLLVRMDALVQSGELAFPRQVAAEMRAARHPDAPGAWAAGVKGWTVHRQPSDESLAEAMGAAQLTDPTSEADREVADPYIVAMALEIAEKCPGVTVVVATEDRVDRMPLKESILTACGRLDIVCCTAEEFVEWLLSGMG